MTDVQAEIDKAVAQVATNYGAEYVKEIKAALSKLGKIASGDLYNSINYNVRIEEDGVHMDLLYLIYLNWINAGRKPGTMPPVSAILKWVQAIRISGQANARRNAIGRFSKGIRVNRGRNSKGQFTSILSQQTSIAWAIAKSIKKKGIKAVPILDDVNAKLLPPMELAAADAAGDTAELYFDQVVADTFRQVGLTVITSN